MTQMSNKGCILFEDSREGVESMKGRLFKGSIGLRGSSIVYFVRVEDCWVES